MSQGVSLLQLIEECIESGEVSLPPYSATASELQQIASEPDFDLDEVEQLLQSDQSLVAELLKVSNSPFYGGLSRVATVRAAIVRVGLSEVVNLAVMACERSRYSKFTDPDIKPYVDPLWEHAVACAFGSRWLAERLGFPEVAPRAFIGGLLHDIGKLMLLWALQDLKRNDRLEVQLNETLIQELMLNAHTDMGYKLAQAWNLPEEYCSIIRDHHVEQFDQTDSLLMLIRLANRACVKVGIGLKQDESIVLPATVESHELGAREVVLAELLVVLEDSRNLAA
ncbi:hypothetical protein ABI59_19295 [Acidobacteria bacterium Mor1]|nr:hypothetical protein ABI59_19295 [Acidobacteria bacterium Mor1]